MDLFYSKKACSWPRTLLHNFSFFWLNIKFLYQNYGLILLETSNLFGPSLMDIFVSLGLSQVDIIVSLKVACSWSTITFYIISAFFYQKLMKGKIKFFDENYGSTPFEKYDFLTLRKMDIFVSLKRLVLNLQHFT